MTSGRKEWEPELNLTLNIAARNAEQRSKSPIEPELLAVVPYEVENGTNLAVSLTETTLGVGAWVTTSRLSAT